MKKVILKEIATNDPNPLWKLDHDGAKENFGIGNQIDKAIDRTDKIHQETEDNMGIILDFHLSRNKPHLRGILFGSKSYFNNIKILGK